MSLKKEITDKLDAIIDKIKDTIPTKVSDLENDSGFLISQDISGKANTSDLATVATTGSYDDLNDKPSIPATTNDLENNSGFITSSDVHVDLTDYVKYNDVKDNLTSTDTNKPLSANQGRLLKLMDEEPMVLKVQGNSFEEYNSSTALQGDNIVVDYGDGTIEPLGKRLTHDYGDGKSSHTIKIYGVTSIGDVCFAECSYLTSVSIPNSVTSLGDACFTDCTGLTSITIPNSITSLNNSCFYGCTSLTSITIPNSVTSIGEACFLDCYYLTSVSIPNSVTSIGIDCFNGCTGLTSITIPNSVTNIGDRCFINCTSLTSITIPNSVTSIGEACFSDCTNLNNYYLNWTSSSTIITYDSEKMPNNNTIFHIPYGTTANYVAKGYPSDKLQEYIKTSEETTDSIIDNDLRPVTSNAVNDALSTKASITQLNNYVAKDGNKVLSSNDFNNNYKNILDNLSPSKVHLDSNVVPIIQYDDGDDSIYLLNDTLIYDIENDVITDGKGDRYVTTHDLSTVATSGSYNDLSNKPAIVEVLVTYTDNTTETLNLLVDTSNNGG